MNNIASFALFILLLLGNAICAQPSKSDSLLTMKQPSPYGEYFFDGEDVVFEFDAQKYTKLLKDNPNFADFSDLKIESVAVQGDFNKLKKSGWKMSKVAAGKFQLRKPLKDLNEKLNPNIKFIINNELTMELQTLRIRKLGTVGEFEQVKPTKNTLVNPQGNAKFKLNGYTNAKKVILSGSFNGWDEQNTKMNRTATGWELTLKLSPGHHQYKFIVDGSWIEDPKNPKRIRNEHDSHNSIYTVKEEHTFRLDNYPNAKTVYLAGTFNDWEPSELKMTKNKDGIWIYQMSLETGKHLYKFIVDGQWITDPANRKTEGDDPFKNSVLMVR